MLTQFYVTTKMALLCHNELIIAQLVCKIGWHSVWRKKSFSLKQKVVTLNALSIKAKRVITWANESFHVTDYMMVPEAGISGKDK